MAAFPTPTQSPSVEGYTEPVPASAVARAEYASGYPLIDDQFTFTPDIWAHSIRGVSTADKDDIKDHWKQYKGTEFLWYCPYDATYYTVIYEKDPEFALDGRTDLWRISMGFRQVNSDTRPILFNGGPIMINIENLAAGSDITDRPVFGSTYGQSFSKIGILTKGTPAGIDDSNTVVLTVKNGAGSTIVTKTYNTATQPQTDQLAQA